MYQSPSSLYYQSPPGVKRSPPTGSTLASSSSSSSFLDRNKALRASLDSQSRSARLNRRAGSPLGMTLFDLDDRDITFESVTSSAALELHYMRAAAHQQSRAPNQLHGVYSGGPQRPSPQRRAPSRGEDGEERGAGATDRLDDEAEDWNPERAGGERREQAEPDEEDDGGGAQDAYGEGRQLLDSEDGAESDVDYLPHLSTDSSEGEADLLPSRSGGRRPPSVGSSSAAAASSSSSSSRPSSLSAVHLREVSRNWTSTSTARRVMDLRRRSARRRDKQSSEAEGERARAGGGQDFRVRGGAGQQHLANQSTEGSRGVAGANWGGGERGGKRPQSAHQVSFGGGRRDRLLQQQQQQDPFHLHRSDERDEVDAERGSTPFYPPYSQLSASSSNAPYSSHAVPFHPPSSHNNSSSSSNNNSDQDRQNPSPSNLSSSLLSRSPDSSNSSNQRGPSRARPVSAHPRVQRGNFAQDFGRRAAHPPASSSAASSSLSTALALGGGGGGSAGDLAPASRGVQSLQAAVDNDLDLDCIFEDEGNEQDDDQDFEALSAWRQDGNNRASHDEERDDKPSRAVHADEKAESQNKYPDEHVWTKISRSGLVSADESADYSRTSKTVSLLLEMIRHRRRTAKKPLSAIFNHFDRRNRGFFDVDDLREALTDLQLPADDGATCSSILSSMSLDSKNRDRVTFGEFCVFVDDPGHDQFHFLVCNLLAKRRVADFMAFNKPHFDSYILTADGQESNLLSAFGGKVIVSADEFEIGLHNLNIGLSPDDISRLMRRFDTSGDGLCSVTKFVRSVTESSYWKEATATIEHHVECNEEAMSASRRKTGNGGLSKDVINAALSLGIRVSSDSDMMWLVYEMLESPLPANWDYYEVLDEADSGGDGVGGGRTSGRGGRTGVNGSRGGVSPLQNVKKVYYYTDRKSGKRIREQVENPLASYYRRLIKDNYVRGGSGGGEGDADGVDQDGDVATGIVRDVPRHSHAEFEPSQRATTEHEKPEEDDDADKSLGGQNESPSVASGGSTRAVGNSRRPTSAQPNQRSQSIVINRPASANARFGIENKRVGRQGQEGQEEQQLKERQQASSSMDQYRQQSAQHTRPQPQQERSGDIPGHPQREADSSSEVQQMKVGGKIRPTSAQPAGARSSGRLDEVKPRVRPSSGKGGPSYKSEFTLHHTPTKQRPATSQGRIGSAGHAAGRQGKNEERDSNLTRPTSSSRKQGGQQWQQRVQVSSDGLSYDDDDDLDIVDDVNDDEGGVEDFLEENNHQTLSGGHDYYEDYGEDADRYSTNSSGSAALRAQAPVKDQHHSHLNNTSERVGFRAGNTPSSPTTAPLIYKKKGVKGAVVHRSQSGSAGGARAAQAKERGGTAGMLSRILSFDPFKGTRGRAVAPEVGYADVDAGGASRGKKVNAGGGNKGGGNAFVII